MFRPVSAELDFVAIEEVELARWKANDVFARSMKARQGAEPWVFYEGPPTANGKPGLHHVWARVYKDLFCRYQTMQGRFVSRRAGWDTHGLPVEVQVEKQLGLSGKIDIIEKVGIEEFTRLCRESVLIYVDEFEKLTERIGYWTDMEHAYYTFHPAYVESVWWQLKQLFDRGLLYEDSEGRSVLPSLWYRLVQSRTRSARRLHRRDRRERVRETAYHRLGSARGTVWCDAPRCLDDDAVDITFECGGRGESRGHVRRGRRHDRRPGARATGVR